MTDSQSTKSSAALDLEIDGAKPYETVGIPFAENSKMTMRHVDVSYGEKQAIFDVSLDIAKNEVIAMIGPSGCGKSTFLRALNRMNDTVDSCVVTGSLMLEDQDIYAPNIDIVALRARVGMVFQKPNPFPQKHLRQCRIRSQNSWTGNQ